MFKYELDSCDKIVRLNAGGFSSSAEVQEMNRQLVLFAADARRLFSVFRMLTDARDAPVQANDVLMQYKLPTEVMESPDDRLAVVVSGSLAKLQVNRLLADKRAQAFLSMDAAKTWLLAHVLKRNASFLFCDHFLNG